MGARADDAATRSERARVIGLFRYGLIREAADPGLSTRARGRLVRAVAAAEHTDPTGRRVRVSRDTLDRWIRAWRRGGFDALVPSPRQTSPRLPVEVVEMAVALKRENPDRTGAQVRRILATQERRGRYDPCGCRASFSPRETPCSPRPRLPPRPAAAPPGAWRCCAVARPSVAAKCCAI